MKNYDVHHISKIYISRRFLNFAKELSKYCLTPAKIEKKIEKKT